MSTRWESRNRGRQSKVDVEAGKAVFKQVMFDMVQAFTSARRLLRFFWKSRDCDSRSMVAVTLMMMPASWQVTQGGSINRTVLRRCNLGRLRR
jgi:hypothetical protein